jgi:hypothetical protein
MTERLTRGKIIRLCGGCDLLEKRQCALGSDTQMLYTKRDFCDSAIVLKVRGRMTRRGFRVFPTQDWNK